MNESSENKEITAKKAGQKVKNMIETVEKKMAAGEKISAKELDNHESC